MLSSMDYRRECSSCRRISLADQTVIDKFSQCSEDEVLYFMFMCYWAYLTWFAFVSTDIIDGGLSISLSCFLLFVQPGTLTEGDRYRLYIERYY